MDTYVYLVIGYHDQIQSSETKENVSVFGVFESKEYAEGIKENILQNFKYAGERIDVEVIPLILGQTTDLYEFFMEN